MGFLTTLIQFVYWLTEDPFQHPEHWYEVMLMCVIFSSSRYRPMLEDFYCICLVLLLLFSLICAVSTVLKCHSGRYFSANVSKELFGSFTYHPSAWSACYLLWVHGLGLRYPMPFTGLGGYVLAMVVTFINIICSFPDR